MDTHINRMLVLRPRLSDTERAAFLVEVFSYLGDGYDFRFDFADASMQVCTEVIYRAINGKGSIDFVLTERGGHETLSAEAIFSTYARRWSIEDLFNQMKNRWGWREAWQQSRQVLHRWTQILSVAYALPQLLAISCGDQVQPLLGLTPWRKKDQVTAGMVRLGLHLIFGNVRVRTWWHPKWRKFQPPRQAEQASEYENPGKPPDIVMSKIKMTANKSPRASMETGL